MILRGRWNEEGCLEEIDAPERLDIEKLDF